MTRDEERPDRIEVGSGLSTFELVAVLLAIPLGILLAVAAYAITKALL